jgi:hypothetical protein
VKNWIKERAKADAFKDSIDVDYAGGDPRFIFTTIYDRQCIKGGQVDRSLGSTSQDSEEIRINTYTAEQIEKLLADNGIIPKESEQVNAEL